MLVILDGLFIFLYTFPYLTLIFLFILIPSLLRYNLVCVLGWAATIYIGFTSLFAGDKNEVVSLFGIDLFTVKPLAPSVLYERLTPIFQFTQTLACLEILHAMTGLVPSAVFTTFVQVMSRIIVLWAFTNTASYTHWSLYQLVLSWGIVEIPRYLFYIWGLLFPNVQAPGLLFFLRYSLFAVLYPTGITAEILQLLNAMPYWTAQGDVFLYIMYALLVTYIPGSPFMYLHMVKMRKSQYKKRNQALYPEKFPAKIETKKTK